MQEVVIEELPPLFHMASKGAIVQWEIAVVTRNNVVAIRVIFGQMDGQKQILFKDILKGKNIGKKNETSPTRQAIMEATSVWTKKKDHGYQEEIPTSGASTLPMLAHNFRDRSHDIKYPAFVQPKLEGIRCTAKKISGDKMLYQSRNGIAFKHLGHLDKPYLEILGVGEEVDGEIFNRDLSFQEIVHRLKSPTAAGEGLVHWLYDFPSFPGGFEARYEELERRVDYLGNDDVPIVLTQCYEVDTYEHVMNWHSYFINQLYEGVMIRNKEGEYRHNYRSPDLQKYKEFQDSEYEIVGIEPGTGRDSDIGNYICKCPRTHLLFGAPSTGDRADRQDLLKNTPNYIGKMLTVTFQRFTEGGIPYLPKGRQVRDYE